MAGMVGIALKKGYKHPTPMVLIKLHKQTPAITLSARQRRYPADRREADKANGGFGHP